MKGNSSTRQFVFIIGSTRSGTTWLHQMLAEHPGVAALKQELSIFSRYVAHVKNCFDAEEIAEKHLDQGLPVIVPRPEFQEFLRTTLNNLYDRVLARNPGATHILDKRPDYCRYVPVIEEFVPSAKYIHIIRDGRDVAISMRSAKKHMGGFTNDLGVAATEWCTSVRAGLSAGALVGTDRFLEVRYERLVSDTSNELSRILDFLNLSKDQGFIDRVATEHHSTRKLVSKGDGSLNELRGTPDAIWRNRLTLKERYVLDRTAGGLLKSLGYARSDWWVVGSFDKRIMWWSMFWQKLGRSWRSVIEIWTNPEYRPR